MFLFAEPVLLLRLSGPNDTPLAFTEKRCHARLPAAALGAPLRSVMTQSSPTMSLPSLIPPGTALALHGDSTRVLHVALRTALADTDVAAS